MIVDVTLIHFGQRFRFFDISIGALIFLPPA
jgi:hypothetical protein